MRCNEMMIMLMMVVVRMVRMIPITETRERERDIVRP